MPVEKIGIRRARDDWICFCDSNVIFAAHPIDCAQFLLTVDDVHRLDNYTPVVGTFVRSICIDWGRLASIWIK